MPLTRFPDHEGRRVYLSTVLSFDLPAPDTSHSNHLSVAILWMDRDSPSARELNLEVAIDLMEHGALGFVVGGTAAMEAGALLERAVQEGEFVRSEEESIGIWVRPGASLEAVLWTASEEAMPPDAYADQPWDLVAWARADDPIAKELRQALPRLGEIVDRVYDEGGIEES